MKDELRQTCFTACHEWGKCTCKVEVTPDKGFIFKGVLIVDPSISECGRFFVEPSVYYGDAYLAWKATI